MQPNAPVPSTPEMPEKHAPWLTIVLIIVGIIAIGILIWVIFMPSADKNNATTSPPPATETASPTPEASPTTSTSSTIQNDTGLQSASNDLDKVNVDSIDTSLSQNDTDAATF